MFQVVVDTCALYPLYLRDALLRLALRNLYSLRWSQQILQELEDALIKHGFCSEAVRRTIAQMAAAFPAAAVEGYQPLIPSMTCSLSDRHVLAAAAQCKAGAIVTFNEKDFPEESVQNYEIQVMQPDAFLLDLFDLAPAVVVNELHQQAAAYQRDPMTLHGLLDALRKAQVPQFAEEVAQRVRLHGE